MKVDANRIQPPTTEQITPNKPPKIHQPESKSATKKVEKSANDTEVAPQQNRAKGAMRLLQEGHFKGVAALRLSINFSAQLSSMEQEAIKVAAQESVGELSQAMQEQIDGLNSSGLVKEETLPQLTELGDTFASEIQNSLTDEKLNPEQLTSILEQHYGNFRTNLQNLLVPQEPTTPQEVAATQAIPTEEVLLAVEEGDDLHSSPITPLETEQPSEPTIASAQHTIEAEETQTELNARLDALDSTFRSQLSNIEERLQNAALPSVPEEPENKGAAFQKFLTIYREMQGMAEFGSKPDEAKSS